MRGSITEYKASDALRRRCFSSGWGTSGDALGCGGFVATLWGGVGLGAPPTGSVRPAQGFSALQCLLGCCHFTPNALKPTLRGAVRYFQGPFDLGQSAAQVRGRDLLVHEGQSLLGLSERASGGASGTDLPLTNLALTGSSDSITRWSLTRIQRQLKDVA